jgi:epoxyqueuosine reductase
MAPLEERLKGRAGALGFALSGLAAAGDAATFPRFRDWLDAGHAGEMGYLRRLADQRRHPRGVLPDVRSVLMVAMCYEPRPPGRGPGARVARYALGDDYHRVLWDRLNELAAWLEAEAPGCRACGVSDTAPLLERDFARRAGLGWFGKNTMLLNKRLGSYFLLGALLTDLELAPDAPFESDHCGTCTACLDACPTHAFPEPGALDARRCISYLTIELRGLVPEDLREGVGPWLFGCDVCQEVCPWNRRAPAGHPALAPRADLMQLDPVELLGLDEQEFRRRFRGTALFRTRRGGILRNAALVLGNSAGPEALPALRRACGDADPAVRDAAAWAISRIEGRYGPEATT